MLCVSNYFDTTVVLAVVAQLHTWMNQNLPRLVACFQEARDLPTDIYTCNNAIECSHQIIVSVEKSCTSPSVGKTLYAWWMFMGLNICTKFSWVCNIVSFYYIATVTTTVSSPAGMFMYVYILKCLHATKWFHTNSCVILFVYTTIDDQVPPQLPPQPPPQPPPTSLVTSSGTCIF